MGLLIEAAADAAWAAAASVIEGTRTVGVTVTLSSAGASSWPSRAAISDVDDW